MLALAVITLLGPSLGERAVVIVVTTFPTYARMARTQTLSLKLGRVRPAERSLGAGRGRILVVHILPNIVGPLLILASMDVPVVITLEAGLSFLGLGVPPPAPSWGRILNEGYAFIREAPWMVVAGGVPLILATLGFTFLGEIPARPPRPAPEAATVSGEPCSRPGPEGRLPDAAGPVQALRAGRPHGGPRARSWHRRRERVAARRRWRRRPPAPAGNADVRAGRSFAGRDVLGCRRGPARLRGGGSRWCSRTR